MDHPLNEPERNKKSCNVPKNQNCFTWSSFPLQLPFLSSAAIVRKWQKPKPELMREKIVANVLQLQNCTFPAERGLLKNICCNFILWLCMEWTWKCFYYPLALLSRPSQTVLAKNIVFFLCWFSFQENGDNLVLAEAAMIRDCYFSFHEKTAQGGILLDCSDIYQDWPLIGYPWSRDLSTGLWLVIVIAIPRW